MLSFTLARCTEDALYAKFKIHKIMFCHKIQWYYKTNCEMNSRTRRKDHITVWRTLFIDRTISSYCSFWRAVSALLLLLLNISPDATARKEKGFTEADDAASFERRNVLSINKVLHTVMWSFLLVLLFILKSRLGTTPSLVKLWN